MRINDWKNTQTVLWHLQHVTHRCCYVKTSKHMGMQNKVLNRTRLRCCFPDFGEWHVDCESIHSNQRNYILSSPGTRSELCKCLVSNFFLLLFVPKYSHKSICFISRRFAETWSNSTKSHLWCTMWFRNPEISTGMKMPCKDSTISTPASSMMQNFYFPYITVSLWKRNRISIYGFYFLRPLITQKDAWDPIVKILEWWYL